MPDGERLARVETRLESLEQQIVEIREDIRELRIEMRDIRAEMRDIRNKIDKQFLWVIGIIITMWISLFVMWGTSMLTLMNRLGG